MDVLKRLLRGNYKMREMICDTYEIKIYVGLKEHYDGIVHDSKEVKKLLFNYVNVDKIALSITELSFVYPVGGEPGVMIGIINYPRYPLKEEELRAKAFKIAKLCMNEFHQERVSIVTRNKTYTLEN